MRLFTGFLLVLAVGMGVPSPSLAATRAGAEGGAEARTEAQAAPRATAASESMDRGGIHTTVANLPMSFWGYGEVHYNNPSGSEIPDHAKVSQIDAHRAVLGWGVDFDENWSMAMEIDYEHAAQELELEFLQVDARWKPWMNFRGGVLLMPFGPLNEFHEPTRFYSVERPYLQNRLIPTTWQEGGVGIFGDFEVGSVPFSYRSYVVQALAANELDAGAPLRDARGKGREDRPADDLAWIGRLEAQPFDWLDLGGSFYWADSTRNNMVTDIDVPVTMWDVNARFHKGPFEVMGEYTSLGIGDAGLLSPVRAQTIPERSVGWNVEGAVHLRDLIFGADDKRDLVPFVRYEAIDTVDRIPVGFARQGQFDREIVTTGLAYFPNEHVALKADVEFWDVDGGAILENDRINAGVAFHF